MDYELNTNSFEFNSYLICIRFIYNCYKHKNSSKWAIIGRVILICANFYIIPSYAQAKLAYRLLIYYTQHSASYKEYKICIQLHN